jgi:hypothetical protein
MAKRGVPEHPKTLKLARKLGLPSWAAVGLLEVFWHWCSRYAITGLITAAPDDVADGIRYTGDADALFAALLESGWIDAHPNGYTVHDVADHADNTWKANLKRAGLEFWNHSVPTQETPSHDEITTESQLSSEPPKPEPEPEPLPEPYQEVVGGCGGKIESPPHSDDDLGKEILVSWWEDHPDRLAKSVSLAILAVPKFARVGPPDQARVERLLADVRGFSPGDDAIRYELENWETYNRENTKKGGQKDAVAALRNWFANKRGAWALARKRAGNVNGKPMTAMEALDQRAQEILSR